MSKISRTMVDFGGMHPPREGQFKNPLVLGKFRSDVHFWHLLNDPIAPAFVCFWAIGFWPCQTARERTSYSVRFGASTLVRADQTVEWVTRRVARRLFQRVLERCYRRLIKTARTSENRREAVFPFRAGANFRYWHKADNPTAPAFVRYWSNSGHAWHWR